METVGITRTGPAHAQLQVIGPDYSAAKEFLDIMHPAEKLCFQTVPKGSAAFKAKILYGHLDDLWDELVKWNIRGADVYCMVNQGIGTGRSNHSVTAITSFFVSVHNAPVDRVDAVPIKPHVIVITSPNSWQAHWRVTPMPVTYSSRQRAADLFRKVQTALAMKVGGDPHLTDLARCAHVPGFFTYKHEPYQVGLQEAPNQGDPIPQFLSVFPV